MLGQPMQMLTQHDAETEVAWSVPVLAERGTPECEERHPYRSCAPGVRTRMPFRRRSTSELGRSIIAPACHSASTERILAK